MTKAAIAGGFPVDATVAWFLRRLPGISGLNWAQNYLADMRAQILPEQDILSRTAMPTTVHYGRFFCTRDKPNGTLSGCVGKFV